MLTIFGTVVPSSEVNGLMMSAYLADSKVNDCMQFWQENVNKFPKLHQLHLKHHCIPTTMSSAAMERCFSAAGYIENAPS